MNDPVKITVAPPTPVKQTTSQSVDQLKAVTDQLKAIVDQQRQGIDMLMLRTNQQQQVIDQYRVAIYNLELRSNLLVKMLEEKNIMAKEEYEKRWPLYLKSEVGFTGPDGMMEGSLKVTFYNGEKK